MGFVMQRRCYRTAAANDELYESMRATIDAAWGLPANGQTTAIDPAATAPHDSQGRVYLATWDAFTSYEPATSILGDALASGAVTEITEAEYRAAVESPSPVS